MTAPDVLYRAALDRLLADLAEFLSRYAWTAQHDESHDLYERIRKAREYLAGVPSAQGRTR